MSNEKGMQLLREVAAITGAMVEDVALGRRDQGSRAIIDLGAAAKLRDQGYRGYEYLEHLERLAEETLLDLGWMPTDVWDLKTVRKEVKR